MKPTKILISILLCLAALALLLPPSAFSQNSGSAKYSGEELAQMLAPIALYPDSLLAQVLMASTYPLEIVEADRWMSRNTGLKGDSLDNALQDQHWDVSVKSLCHFPEVLAGLSQKLEQTTKLGDAFLAQEDDVMNTVQELRQKANAKGNLKTTNEQKVVVEEKIIKIEPAAPEVVYVPVYDPMVIYGPWWYPAHPPFYWWRPAVYAPGPLIVFGPRIHVGPAIGWCGFGWRERHVNVYVNKTYVFNKVTVNKYQNNVWHHDTDHRKGVAYRDRGTAERFGQAPARSVEGRKDLKGYSDKGPFDRQKDLSRKGGEKPFDAGKADPGRIGPADRRPDLGKVDPGKTTPGDKRLEPGKSGTSEKPLDAGKADPGKIVPDRRPDMGKMDRDKPTAFDHAKSNTPSPGWDGSMKGKLRDNAFSGLDRGRQEKAFSERGKESRSPGFGGGGFGGDKKGGSHGGKPFGR